MSKQMLELAEELREYTAMKYAGDCKCGKCQLVPRRLVERIYHALNSTAIRSSADSENPVAWFKTDVSGRLVEFVQSKFEANIWREQGFILTEVYTHPAPSASVREALEDLTDAVFDAGLSALVMEPFLSARRALAEPAPDRDTDLPTANDVRGILGPAPVNPPQASANSAEEKMPVARPVAFRVPRVVNDRISKTDFRLFDDEDEARRAACDIGADYDGLFLVADRRAAFFAQPRPSTEPQKAGTEAAVEDVIGDMTAAWVEKKWHQAFRQDCEHLVAAVRSQAESEQ